MRGANGIGTGSPRDGGIAAILVEIREMRREAAQDRRRADARFEEVRREAAADREAMVQMLSGIADILSAQHKTLERIEAGQREMMTGIRAIVAGQQVIVRAIGDLGRVMRPPRNGRHGGNGKHRK